MISYLRENEILEEDQIKTLDRINTYSKKYHHDQNNNADNEKVNETELRTYINLVLNFIESDYKV